MQAKRQHAIVLGASMAGLLTARVLSEQFERVTLVERDRLPDEATSRKGVPQSRHAHGLLARGLRTMEQLFPGLTASLVAGGAVSGDIGRDACWYQFGGYKVRADVGLPGVVMTRPYLEAHIRQRVLGRSNVVAIQEADILGLLAAEDRGRLLGISLRRHGGQPEQLLADLTVDATGRGTQSPKWLETLGYGRPAESIVKINVGYTSRLYERKPGDSHAVPVYIIAATPPEGKRYGSLLAVEGQRWIVTLIGFLGDHSPTDEAGFLEFARSLPTPDIYQHVQSAQPLRVCEFIQFPADFLRPNDKRPANSMLGRDKFTTSERDRAAQVSLGSAPAL